MLFHNRAVPYLKWMMNLFLLRLAVFINEISPIFKVKNAAFQFDHIPSEDSGFIVSYLMIKELEFHD